MVRPKKKPADVKRHGLHVRLTAAERRLVEQAAGAKDATVSEWARDTLVRAARRTQKGTT